MRRPLIHLAILLSTAATVDMLFGIAPIGPTPIHWAWHYFIQSTEGVNPWVYAFMWLIVSAPPWYYGLHLAITGFGSRDRRRMMIGVTLNRVGVLIPPVYVAIAASHLPTFGFVLDFLLPFIFTGYFVNRLKNEAWRNKYGAFIDRWIVSTWIRLVSVLALVVQAVFYRVFAIQVRRKLQQIPNLPVCIAESPEDVEAICALEDRVFQEEGYPHDYRQYNAQSILLGVWDGNRIVGALRLIFGFPRLPPVLDHCTVRNPKWREAAVSGNLEELGTIAIDSEYRGRGLAPLLYRAAFASALARGIQYGAFIIEPARAAKLNRVFGTAFRQRGPLGFRGWPCAPFVGDLRTSFARMRLLSPVLHAWFLEAHKPEPQAAHSPITEQQGCPATTS